MSAIKSVVKYLANRFLTKEDLLPDLLAQQSDVERATSAITFFKKEAPLLTPGTKEYVAAISVAQDLLLSHYRAGSFLQLCRSQTRKNSQPEYYAIATMGQIIAAHNAEPTTAAASTSHLVSGGEAGVLLAQLALPLADAKAEGNFIKRRSIVRKAIVAALPGLTSDRAAALTELALHIG